MQATATLPPASAVGSLSGRWWVCQTRPRYEQRLADDLARGGIAHYLPLCEITRYETGKDGRTRRRRVMQPEFPGYLFLNGRAEDRYAAARSIATIRTIDVADQCRLRKELIAIELTLGVDPTLRSVAGLRAGVAVRITDGPLANLEGTVERIGGTVVYLPVTLMGRSMPAEVNARFIEPLN